MDDEQAANILGVELNASDKEIEEKYQNLVKKNHPDKGGSSELFKQIKQAYDVLTGNTEANSSGSGISGTDSSEESQDEYDEFDTNNKYTLNTISELELDKLVKESFGKLVTKNRLTKKKPGMTHPQTLTDKPLLEYIHKKEQPHFTLRFNKISILGETLSPENGGFLILTDIRILVIMGTVEGDEQFSFSYTDITDVDSWTTILGSHKFMIEHTEGEVRFKFDHSISNELQITSLSELNQEFETAEKFIREAAYKFMG